MTHLAIIPTLPSLQICLTDGTIVNCTDQLHSGWSYIVVSRKHRFQKDLYASYPPDDSVPLNARLPRCVCRASLTSFTFHANA